jgi:uncharacterized protein DUF1837
MDFEVIIDNSLLKLGITEGVDPAHNKGLLSVINDFEDGKWRREKFDSFVWDNIAETALSQKEREALEGQPQSLLTAAAKNLRLTDAEKDIGKGSELAEIVLYGIMRHKYGALPVVPKIFHKQNAQDNAKGADSVHIILEADGDFTLWFGEAKFYNSIEDPRLNSIVESVKKSLDTKKLKKENSIIINLPDLDQLVIAPDTRNKIKQALANKNSIDSIKQLINIPILILHECAITAEASEITDEYVEKITKFHKDRAISYFRKQISALKDISKYSEVRFHLILFPVPEKQPIIDEFVKSVTHYKG